MDYPPVGTSWTLRFATDFLIFSKIGEGTFSTVHQVVNRVEGCFYALKKVHYDPSGDRQSNCQALTEVQLSTSLGVHDNIVRYFTSFYENQYLYIQYELCNHNLKIVSLDNKKFTSQKALLNMIYQIAVAFSFITHSTTEESLPRPDQIRGVDLFNYLEDIDLVSPSVFLKYF